MSADLSTDFQALSVSGRGKSALTAGIKSSEDFNLELSIRKVRQTFGEQLSPSSEIFRSSSNPREEAILWECFAEVFEKELAMHSGQTLSLELKRRILADILVWAELTQKHYNQSTLQFVVAPNEADASFVRIGTFFRDAKALRGLD